MSFLLNIFYRRVTFSNQRSSFVLTDDSAFMCTRKYGDAPDVIISGSLNLTFPYAPTHLRKSAPRALGCLIFSFISHICFHRLHHAGAAEKQHESNGRVAW